MIKKRTLLIFLLLLSNSAYAEILTFECRLTTLSGRPDFPIDESLKKSFLLTVDEKNNTVWSSLESQYQNLYLMKNTHEEMYINSSGVKDVNTEHRYYSLSPKGGTLYYGIGHEVGLPKDYPGTHPTFSVYKGKCRRVR
jgi:hypothetical protein